MSAIESSVYIQNLIKNFNFYGKKKYKLLIILGLLGDFDSFEYVINLKKYLDNEAFNIDIFAIAIGNEIGKDKFCKFTGFPSKNLKTVKSNQIHFNIGASKGMDIGLGGWINMLLMLSGINSLKTIKEVIRGYTGSKNSKQIFYDIDEIDLLKVFKFSGKYFKKTFGDGYLRPFELATFRLINMIEIINNWDDYILDTKYLPQRGASFILNSENKIIYQYFSKDVLDYAPLMDNPLGFISEVLKNE